MKSSLTKIIALFLWVTSIHAYAQTDPQANPWATSFTGASGSGNAQAIKTVLDASSNMYVIGTFTGSAVFGSFNLVGGPTPSTFIVKYSPAGSVFWAQRISGTITPRDLALAGGTLVVGGTFSQTVNFNPSGTALNKTSVGNADVFLCAYNANTGTVSWVKNFGSTSDDIVLSLSSDGTDLYLGGYIAGDTEFNPEGPSLFRSPGSVSTFLGKCNATTGTFAWVRTFGMPPSGLDVAASINGFYVMGGFSSPLDLGNGIVLTPVGASDIFFAKLDGISGSTIWGRQIGSASFDMATAIAVSSTHVYILGSVSQVADINGTLLRAFSSPSVFVARFAEGDGTTIEAKQIGKMSGPAIIIPNDVSVNSTSMIVTGIFKTAQTDFNFSNPSLPMLLDPLDPVNGSSFIAKYPLGQPAQLPVVKRVGYQASFRSIAADDNAIAIAGQLTGSVDFNAGAPTVIRTSVGATSSFIARYATSTLTATMASVAGSPTSADDLGSKVRTDGNGNVYVAGNFRSYDLTVGTTHLINQGGQDAFIAKMNSSGVVQWVKQIGGPSDDYIQDLMVTTTTIGATGYFYGTTEFNIGGTSSQKTSAGDADIFLSQYDVTTGNLVWVKSFGGFGADKGNAVQVATNGIYIGGSFNSTANFNDSGTPFNLSSAGFTDCFIGKYNLSTGDMIWAIRDGGAADDAVNDLVDDGISVYATGYTYTSNSRLFVAKYSGADGTTTFFNTSAGTGSAAGIGIGLRGPLIAFVGNYSGNITYPSAGFGNAVANSVSSTSDVVYTEMDLNNGKALAAALLSFGGTGQEYATDLFCTGGDTYVTGTFTAAINGGVAPTGLTNPTGNQACFLFRAHGPMIAYATAKYGINGQTAGTGITADNTDIYLTGHFNNQIVLPSGTRSTTGLNDIFIGRFDARLTQTINFNPIGTTLTCPIPTAGLLNATSTSGAPVTYASSDTGIATITGTIITGVAAGTFNVIADQSGSPWFYPATPVSKPFTVNRGTPNIVMAPIPPKVFGDAPFPVSVSSNSTGQILFSSTNTQVATVTPNPPAIATIVGGGSTNIVAFQAMDGCYNSGSRSAVLNVAKANPVISFTSANTGVYYADPMMSVSTGGSTGAVTYSVVNGTGAATVSGNVLQLRGVGDVTVTASVATDNNYTAASTSQVFTITKAPLSASANNQTKIYGDANPTLTIAYTGFFGTDNETLFGTLPIAQTSAVLCSGVASYPITITPGSALANYNVTYADGTLSVTPADVTVTANNKTKIYGTANPTLTLTYTSKCGDDFDVLPTATTTAVTSSPVGIYPITVNPGSDPFYTTTPGAGQLTIVKADQIITFNSLPLKTYNDPSFNLSSSSTSGLPITYSSSNTAVATVLGNTVTIVGAGTTTITASQPGDGNYNAAIPVDQTLTVNKASQTISFNALPDKVYGASPFQLSATASTGLAVTFSSSNTNVIGISNGNTAVVAGAGTSTITASQAGNANYLAASTSQPQNVLKAAQSITFSPIPPKTYGNPPFTPSVSTTSGLAVTLTSSNTAVATISGSNIVIVGAGTSNITASQSGNANYLAATPALQPLTVNKADQTINFPTLPGVTYGATNQVTLGATSSSGLPITYTSSNPAVATVSGNTLTIVGAGTATITASQAGNSNYNPASASQPLTVNKGNQTVTFNPLSPVTYGTVTQFTLSASASTGLPITFSSSNTAVATISGNILNVVGAGTTTITASQAGNSNYNPGSASQPFTVNKGSQTISFTAIGTMCVPASKTLNATSSVGLPITFSSSNTSVASVSGTTITAVAAGTATITATQAGNANYNSATVTQPVTVSQPPATLAGNGSNAFCAGGSVRLTANTGSGLSYQWERDGSVIPGSQYFLDVSIAGKYTVVVTNTDACSNRSNAIDVKNGTSAVTLSPTSATVCPGSSIFITSSFITVPTNYQWKRNGTVLSGKTSDYLEVTMGGAYTVTTTTTYGCVYTSSPSNITFSSSACYPCDAMMSGSSTKGSKNVTNNIIYPCDPMTAASTEAYPNPADREINVQLADATETQLPVKVFNQIGVLVATSKVGAGESSIKLDTSDYPDGFYNIQIETGEGKIVNRRVVVKH